MEITGGTIEGNKATLGGGIAVCGMIPYAIPIGPSHSTGGSGTTTPGLFINGTEEKPVQIKNNSAEGWKDYSVGGGGVLLYHLKDTNQASIGNAVISDNTVTNGPGGGIESLQLSSSFRNHLELADVVLTGNHAAKGGGICLYNDTSTGTMEANFSNTVITENTATERFMFIGTQCDLWDRSDGTGHEK